MRSATQSGFDAHSMREAISAPGIDPRQWISFGLVNPKTAETPDDPIEFVPGMGPIISVTLQPSGTVVSCRVASSSSGQGESEYWPFIDGDEVLVAIPEGDERAGCTIIGRLNNEIDTWPESVASQDATKNTFAFKRVRTPFIFETSSSYLLRSAGTGAFFSITQDGRVTISDADNAFLSLTPDFIGLQSGDGNSIIQIDLHTNSVVLQAGSSKLTIGDNTVWTSNGDIAISGAGLPAIEHAATVEGVVNLLNALMHAIGTAIAAALPGLIVTPAAGAPLGPLIGLPLAAVFGAGATGLINGALATAGAGTIAPFTTAIGAALAAKPGDPSGNFPGVGSPGVKIG